MNKIAIIFVCLITMLTMNASEHTEKKNKLNNIVFCCYFTGAVPPCSECVERRKKEIGQTKTIHVPKRDQYLSQSQELRFP